MHKSVHVHTHLDSPRNSHMTQGQRRTVAVLFTLTQATRHTPHQAPQTYTHQTPCPTHKYTYVYSTVLTHSAPGRELLRFLLRYVHPQTKTYTHQRHTVSTTARRLTRARTTSGALPQADRPAETADTPHRDTPILPHKHRCVYTPDTSTRATCAEKQRALPRARAHTHADAGARPAHRQRLQPAVPGRVLPHSGDAAASRGGPCPLPLPGQSRG